MPGHAKALKGLSKLDRMSVAHLAAKAKLRRAQARKASDPLVKAHLLDLARQIEKNIATGDYWR